MAKFTVNNNNDSGAGSLRQAIIDAGNAAGVDTIDLTSVSGTINLNSSLGNLNTGNDINFVDDGNTTISGQNAYQIIGVNGASVTFSRLTFVNGLARGGDGNGGGGGGLGAGGALFINAGNVTLNSVTFTGNRAVGGNALGNAGSGAQSHLLQWERHGSDQQRMLRQNAGNSGAGGVGGGFNINGSFNSNSGGLGGSNGSNGIWSWYGTGSTASTGGGTGGNGGNANFGQGGGGAGGGGAGGYYFDRWNAENYLTEAGSGGQGGHGGFGGGGGGGGGAAGRIRYFNYPDNESAYGPGNSGGQGGQGGQGGFGGQGGNGNSSTNVTDGNNWANSIYGQSGGQGGGGAGLGGAIFVRSGANLVSSLGNVFSGNSATGGAGANNGQGIGNDIFFQDGSTPEKLLVVKENNAPISRIYLTANAKNISEVATQVVNNQNLVTQLANFANALGFAYAGGTNSQYVGDGFEIINTGTSTNPSYKLQARYNAADPYASGYLADKRLSISLSNFQISIDPTSFTFSDPRSNGIPKPIVSNSAPVTNQDSKSIDAITLSLSDTKTESLQHSTTANFTAGIKTGFKQQWKVGVPGAETTNEWNIELNVSASGGWTNSNTTTKTVTSGTAYSGSVAARSERIVSLLALQTSSSVDYTSEAQVSFDISYSGFLTPGNAREDFPRDRPFVTVKLNTDQLQGINNADLSNVTDNTGKRYVQNEFNTTYSQYAQNVFKAGIIAPFSGTFSGIYGTTFAYQASANKPLDGTLSAVLEDITNPIGSSLSTLFDQPITSISVLSNPNNTAQGVWQFQNAGNWQNISTGQTLSGNDVVRFLPSANYNGTPDRLKVNFAFIDRWIGASITGVNDAPVISSGQINNINITGNTNLTSLGLTGLSYSPGGGSDEATQTLTYTVTAIPDSSVGSIVLADGTTAVTTNTAYTLQQLQGMQFKRAGNSGGTGNFAFTVKDNGGTANGGVDTLSQSLTTVVEVVSPTITLAVSPSSVTEDGTTNFIYTFTRTGATTNALTVNYGIAGTADSSDYTGATPGTGKTITFAAGASTATLTIDPTADTTVESNETVALTLATGTGYTIGTTTSVTGTITNDDIAPPSITLAVSPSSVTEDGTTNLIYTFTRTGATTNALTVNYGIAGTANSSDYKGATPGTGKTITFAAGASTATLTIDPTADTTVESNETVALTLATGTGYTIGTTTAVTGTITNDDVVASPTITLAVSPSSVTEDGTTNLIYTFTRTGATTNALTVNYGVAGTATFNNDYIQIGAAGFTATTGTITFAAGSSTKTLTIDPTADTTVETDETVALTLATGTGYTVGTNTAVTGTITNDDTVGPLTLTGDATNNNLVGGSGNDTFLGLGGNDTLTGGLGADRFRFNSLSDRMDTITDFSKAQGDKIELFATGFNSLVWTDGVTNALAPSVFSMGTSANSWTNSIIYNNSNGIVYFDADALGSGSQVALAQLSPGLNLTNQDFIVSWV